MKVSALKLHKRNPREISREAMDKLKQSIERDPEFMTLRPMVVDTNNVVQGGNQRLKAIRELGYKDIPDTWVVKADDLDPEKLRRFMLVDNAPQGMAGDWDIDLLQEHWTDLDLGDLGFDLAVLDMEFVERDGDDRSGTSPWERMDGDPHEGVLFSLGDITCRISKEAYEIFAKNCPDNNISLYVEKVIYAACDRG